MGANKFVKTNISSLWQMYLSNSVYVCFNKYALQIIEDEQIRSVYTLAQQISDRLMMMQIATLISLAISNYGSGMSVSTRMDLGPIYAAAIARKGKLGLDVANVMIKNGWLEQPPLAADRKALAEQR